MILICTQHRLTYELAYFQGTIGGGEDVDVDVIEVPPSEMSWFRADGSLAYWWMAALPICALLFIQIFPLPQWVIGFITGTLITGPLVGYVTWSVTKDDGKSGAGIRQVPFDEKIGQKVAKKPAIIVQEELERKVVWMNLWPTKKGPYDPLTYDVRRTSTVRVMLHGPWIEMR